MTRTAPLPPKQQQLMDELEAIGRRVGPGGITPEEADALSAEVMQRLNRQMVQDVDAQLAGHRRTRRFWVSMATAVIIAAGALALLR